MPSYTKLIGGTVTLWCGAYIYSVSMGFLAHLPNFGCIRRLRTTGDKGYACLTPNPWRSVNVKESRRQGTGVAQCLWQSPSRPPPLSFRERGVS
ncbi:MAG: hypothetical protein ACK4QL_09345 [Pseudanabaenaceae cyanobacterium]